MSGGHVEIVMVYRCGLWPEDCAGDERGCHDERCRETCRHNNLSQVNLRQEITHAQFLRDYGRCPDSCRPGTQLSLLDDARATA